MDEIEIPEAIRDNVELPKQPKSWLSLPLIIFCTLCIGGVSSVLLFLFFSPSKFAENQVLNSLPKTEADNPSTKPDISNSQTSTKTIQKSIPETNQETASTDQNTIQETIQETTPTQPNQGELLGHLSYDVASKSELDTITADGQLQLRSNAAVKFRQMQAAAQAEGINLIPISAFRTMEDQEQLFFGIKEQRFQNAVKRAEVSAPPGYSEHHTGYAVDLGDGNAPATHLEPTFANTAAFRWLEKNALRYSFELSFPPNNEQGVSYEPWHWRFVGDRHSLETFYKVRN